MIKESREAEKCKYRGQRETFANRGQAPNIVSEKPIKTNAISGPSRKIIL